MGRTRLSPAARPSVSPLWAGVDDLAPVSPGGRRLRGALYMCALSAKHTNKAMAGFVRHMAAASGETLFRPCKPPKVILVAVARKLLVYAHAVIRTQKPFTMGETAFRPTSPDAPSPA